MGAAGRKTVQKCTINAVVADLLNWYELGRKRCRDRSTFVTLLCIAVLIPSIIFAVISIAAYLYLVC